MFNVLVQGNIGCWQESQCVFANVGFGHHCVGTDLQQGNSTTLNAPTLPQTMACQNARIDGW